MTWDYKKAGVDLNKHHEMHRLAIDTIRGIADSLGLTLQEYPFTRSIRSGDHEITLHVDGVGTKSIIALMSKRLDVIGWDCVIGNINDIACDGFKPLALVDYIATQHNDPGLIEQVLDGVSKAALITRTAVLGGETAIMPDLVNGIDVACSVIGIKKIDIGKKIVNAGDVIIGLESNGPHMNGYTLIRKVLLNKYDLNDNVCNSKLVDLLLKPTVYYGDLLLNLYEENLIKAAVNITGGGFTKINRVLGKVGIDLNVPEPPCIFQVIKEEGNVDWDEMYRVFNMGIGMVLITKKEQLSAVEYAIRKYGFNYWVLGRVVDNPGIRIRLWNGNLSPLHLSPT